MITSWADEEDKPIVKYKSNCSKGKNNNNKDQSSHNNNYYLGPNRKRKYSNL
jgi:hypothetical protein